MAKKIYTVLKLKDEFSKPLKNATKEEKAFAKQAKLATAKVNQFATKAATSLANMAKKAALAVTALGVVAGKVGLSEAMNLEGYKAQLETATKDTKKAGEIFKKSVQLANSTPFETGEVVEAAAKFESMGMDSNKWVSLAGDMAGATSKGMDQAVEALIDAQTGELERLKEFGITKNMIAEHAEAMGKAVVNNKGQITDLEGFNDALTDLMNSKFAGGMEKQAQTISGTWSTVTGVTKNALAQILGMTDDGTIAAGSALDIVKQKMQSVSAKLQEWQSSGKIEAIREKVGTAVNVVIKVLTAVGKVIQFVADHMNVIGPIVAVVVAGFLAFKIVTTVITIFQTFSAVMGIVTTVMTAANIAMSPMLLIIIAIVAAVGLLVAAGVYLYKHWDTVRAKLQPVIDLFKTLVAVVIDGFKARIQVVIGVFQKIISVVKIFVGFIANDFKAKLQVAIDVFNAIRDAIKAVIDKVKALIQKLKDSAIGKAASTIAGAFGGDTGKSKGKVTGHATGTSYWRGGITRVNEFGGEIINLPSGAQIIPHDISEKAAKSGSGTTIQVNIAGNVIGNEAFANYIGEVIAKRIAKAQAVM